MDELLSSAALNPGSMGPTLPPMQPFQIPTINIGLSGSTGPTGLTLFFTPLVPDPDFIDLPPNTNNVLIMEVFVPIENKGDRVLLNATIGTDISVHVGENQDAAFNVNAITYQLFRDNVLLTKTSVSGSYLMATAADTLYTFNSTFTWVDAPGNPIAQPDPVHYRVIANIGDLSYNISSALVGNRGFSAINSVPA
ncbi:exosporium leader peptide-containing protein (plasmid) [Bacillus sp. RA(2023)]|uniref:exosporium leader peptide-containing protein n=1 Tax=Bacillus TaxID=1386 RepID=UPI0012F89F51|nr:MULTISPECIES: exosporium leader peptide-containing protein [Bacillus]WPU77909.1 exosporium leader peptide-containing protein [Bacillus sp. RA(2023)]